MKEKLTNKQIAINVMARLSINVMNNYKEDMLYDIFDVVEKLERGETVTILTRTTGSDLIDRFYEKNDESFDSALKKCEKYLGWDVMTRIEGGKVKVKFNDRGNKDFTMKDFRRLVDDMEYYGLQVTA